jgi:hypothetical protein
MYKLDTYGTVEIPYLNSLTNTLMVYEDYLLPENKYKYDTSSIKMVEFANITENDNISDIEEYINSSNFNDYLSAKIDDIKDNFNSDLIFSEDDNLINYQIPYTPHLSNLNNIEKFNNIYV